MKKYILTIFLFFPLTIMAITENRLNTEEPLNALYDVLREKHIAIAHTFQKLLDAVGFVGQERFGLFCEKATIFFQSLHQNLMDTRCLTKVLDQQQRHINDFISRDEDEISYIASLEDMPIYCDTYRGQGFPRYEDIRRNAIDR